MMLEWTEEAVEDVEGLCAHIAIDSPAAADRVADRIMASAAILQFYPELGRAVPELAARVKFEPKHGYKLLYEVDRNAGVVRVLRVFHPRQNRP